MDLTKREKRKLRLGKLRQDSQEAQKEYGQRAEQQKHLQEHHQKSSKTKYYIIAAVAGILIIAAAAYSVYLINRPGTYDDFAKCLTENGAVVYGAIEWCHFTQAQRGMFGNSWKYLNYQDFTKLPGIKKTPTWVINGKWYENVQSFDKLSALTGCKV